MSTSKKYLFVNTGGVYHPRNGKPVKRGERFYSDVDLRKSYKNHFELVNLADDAESGEGASLAPAKPEKPAKTKGRPSDAPEISVNDDADADDASEDLSKYGTDVTKKFASAKKQGLLVFETEDNKFQIVDPKDASEPLNSKPLSLKKVEGFVEQYATTDDESEE
jgi:hypothetical protein